MQLWVLVIVQGVAIGATLTACVALTFTLLVPVTAIRIWRETNASRQRSQESSLSQNEQPVQAHSQVNA